MLGDMRSAMGWAMRTDREVDAMRLAADLRLYWVIEGRMQEGRQWLESALAAERGSDPDDRAHALLAAAYLSLHSFDPRRQAELTSEAVELGHSSEDPSLRSRSMVLDGWSKVFVDPVLARRLLEAGRDLAVELGESPASSLRPSAAAPRPYSPAISTALRASWSTASSSLLVATRTA
ncbi:MAG: hypothetical protein WKF58_18565 [Ilumatobacteraceae bacterium]